MDKNASFKTRVIWKNFIKLMSVVLAFILVAVLLIYNNALSVIQNEFCLVNANNAAQLQNNFTALIAQTDRLAASLIVDTDAQIYFYSDTPDAVDTGFYRRLQGKLKSYSFGVDYISSLLVYAPMYDRLLNDGTSQPYSANTLVVGEMKDVGWMKNLVSLGNEREYTSVSIRAVNDRYPYVLTLVKQYRTLAGEGVVVINLDLKKMYRAIWPGTADGTSVWVLDGSGRILIERDKQQLYADFAQQPDLRAFSGKNETISLLQTEEKIPRTYAQQYNAEYDLYFVSVSTLIEYNERIWKAQMNTLLVGLGGILAAAGLVLLYSFHAFRPLKSIMDLLDDPNHWADRTATSESEIREISDRIISNLQTNDALRDELNKRMDILRQTQIQALQAQLNPHFLFNTLDVIGIMIEKQEGDDAPAAQVSAYLADILRYSLSGNELIPLGRELEYTRKYVYILECRYGGSFRTRFDFPPEMMKVSVPRLILQPLIENAVFHGIAAREDEQDGLLSIRGRFVEHTFEQEPVPAVCLDITDNGRGMTEGEVARARTAINDEDHVASGHIGIQNVAKRLSLLFPHNSEVDIHSMSGYGTCVSLIFPRMVMPDEKAEQKKE